MGFSETVDYYWNEKADKRTNDWFMVGSPYLPLLILFSYLYFVLKCGPEYMKNRKPYSLKTFIKWYNIFQIVANAAIVYSLIYAGWFTTISLGCVEIDYSDDPQAVLLTKIVWWTYMLKVVDLIETGLFILRKKNRQVSFLHLYHHVSTVFFAWISTKYIAGGMATFSVVVNSTVHVIMYTYYYGSTHSSPTVKAIITPIKRYITIIQMVQFVILLTHAAQALMPSCNVPPLPAPIFIVNLLINFYLFYDFYRKNYQNESQNKAKAH